MHDEIQQAQRSRIVSELVTLAAGVLSVPVLIFSAWLYVMSL